MYVDHRFALLCNHEQTGTTADLAQINGQAERGFCARFEDQLHPRQHCVDRAGAHFRQCGMRACTAGGQQTFVITVVVDAGFESGGFADDGQRRSAPFQQCLGTVTVLFFADDQRNREPALQFDARPDNRNHRFDDRGTAGFHVGTAKSVQNVAFHVHALVFLVDQRHRVDVSDPH